MVSTSVEVLFNQQPYTSLFKTLETHYSEDKHQSFSSRTSNILFFLHHNFHFSVSIYTFTFNYYPQMDSNLIEHAFGRALGNPFHQTSRCIWKSCCNTGRIEISFTTYTQRFYLEPSFETYHTYCGYSTPDPVSWRYFDTGVNNNIKIDCVLNLYGFSSF